MLFLLGSLDLSRETCGLHALPAWQSRLVARVGQHENMYVSYIYIYIHIYIYIWVQVKIQGPEQGPGPHPFHTPVPYLRSIPV